MKNSYPCSQSELYTACELGWNSCTQQLPLFADFKAKYTAQYITDRLTEIQAAENLPDEQVRNAIPEQYRIQLEQAAQSVLSLYQRLKRYIAEAYPPELQKPQLEAAGQLYYNAAANNNWDKVKLLLISANNYLTNHLNDLTANQNMPATFPATFATQSSTFNTLHIKFLDSEEIATIQAQQKIQANNNIYAALISMFLDGQEIFRQDEATQKQFIFTEVLQKISGAGTAGIKGYITDSQNEDPISDANIQILNKSTLTDADGHYQILQLPAGIHTLKIEVAGYQPKTQTVTISIGTISTINITLTAI